jgi:hypothetical protein
MMQMSVEQQAQMSALIQRTFRGEGTQASFEPVQAKLTVGEPGDKYEQEADAVAHQVVEQINAPKTEGLVQRQSELGGAILPQITVMRKSAAGVSEGASVTQDVEQGIQQARGGGQTLDESVREPMEKAFGADFSGVRVHTNGNADQLNRSISARAFTTGQDIFFKQGEYNPGSRGGQELLAHELTHVVQQTGNNLSLQRESTGELQPQGKDIQKLGIVYKDEGVNLRDHPLPGDRSRVVQQLPFNTKLFVDKELPGGWYFVTLTNGEYGYVTASQVKTNLPEPSAKLHKIKSGESAIGIAEQYYKANAQSWGEDLRFYVNVLEFVNRGDGLKGLYKVSPNDSWENTKTRDGYLIWIPSVGFAKTLKGQVKSGSITYEAWTTLKNTAIAVGEFILGGGAFIAGLLHGALESVWDSLVGLKDLAVMLWDVLESLFQGTLLTDAQQLWDSLSKLDVNQLIEAGLQHFLDKWNHPELLKRWHFRGWVCGYAIAEIAMLVLSDGILTAVKWAGKAGKFSKILAKFPAIAKFAEKLKVLKSTKFTKFRTALKGSKVLLEARQWAAKVLLVPAEILKDLSLEAIERLKTIPAWAQQQISTMTTPAKRALLGCASPCKVNLRAIWRRLEKVVEIRGVLVRGFRNAGELMERVGNLRNHLKGLKFKNVVLDDVQIGLRGSSVTGVSSKGGGFRWLPDPNGLKASDVDFFFTSPKLEGKLDSLGAHFKPDGRLDPDVLARFAPEVAEKLKSFSEQTTQQLGRKANAILLRKSLANSLKSGEHIIF